MSEAAAAAPPQQQKRKKKQQQASGATLTLTEPATAPATQQQQQQQAPAAAAVVVVARPVSVNVRIEYADGEEQRGVFHCFTTESTERELLTHILREVKEELLSSVKALDITQAASEARLPWLSNARGGKYLF